MRFPGGAGMKKVALYSSTSNRTRKSEAFDAPAPAAEPESAEAAAGSEAAPVMRDDHGRDAPFHRRYGRFERPILILAGVLFVVVLVFGYARMRPAPREYTQKDIDAAVLHTLENHALPSMASRAFAAIEPSVVRVTGYGVVKPDGGKGGRKSGERRSGGNGDGREQPSRRGGFHNFPDTEKGQDQNQENSENKNGNQEKEGSPQAQADENDPFDRNEKGEKLESVGVGTGVVIVDKGVILTNLHVVLGAEKIKLRFFDGMESEATMVGARPEHDLAVLQAKSVPDDLQPAALRSTADLQLGDQVVAVGFPFGIGPSASAGVVSGLQREYHSPEGERVLTNLIQFDAAANPGNSGGPLVTADGEVVGIVTGILNPTSQRVFIGIGFAVPIENAAAAAGMSPF
jgi:S1-C subfamily serine protease